MIVVTTPTGPLTGTVKVPGDKSITHRAIMIGSIANGVTEISDYLIADDSNATINCFQAMGVNIRNSDNRLIIVGNGLKLKPSDKPLYAANSGTTARIIMGILAGQHFTTDLKGDLSLTSRPMKRVMEPLQMMGALFECQNDRLPVKVIGGDLNSIEYKTKQASAQVKSAVLMAGLFAEGNTTVIEPCTSRNHTELMLEQFGAEVNTSGVRTTVKGKAILRGNPVRVPGDISSAAYFMVAAAIIPGSEITLVNVGINKTRSGIIDVLKMMGADITLEQKQTWGNEPVANITVRGDASLNGVEIYGELIPRLIDEIPVLTVAAAVASGRTVIRDAQELRVKESDRIAAMVRQLGKMGVNLQEREDGIVVDGGKKLVGACVESEGDHRVAMSMAVAGLIAEGETVVYDAEALNVSYPRFINDLRSVVDN